MLNLSSFATRLKREWEKQGVKIDPFTPEEMKEREERLRQKAMSEAREAKLENWHKESLWSGEQPIKFTFDNWKPEKQENRQLAATLGNRAYFLSGKMAKQSFNVLMVGEAGTGKTSLALAMASRLEKDFKKKYLFISTTEITVLFNRIYRNDYGASDRMERLYTKARQAPVLILDDFGTETGMRKYDGPNGSHYKASRIDLQEWLYRLTNARYGRPNRSTIITSNNSAPELLEMYNDKLISRLLPKDKDKVLIFDNLKDVRGRDN